MANKLRFQTKFCDYELIQTQDESWAIYSDFYKEVSHSLVGAVSETKHNFLIGCDIEKNCAQKDIFCVLEVGFGIGNGLATTFEFWQSLVNRPKRFVFVTQEIDPELIDYSFAEGPYQAVLEKLHLNSPNEYTFEENGARFEVKVLSGDARETINQVQDHSIHAIFQDAYSPGKNPSLWTVEWFEQLRRVAADSAVMATYSASARIRKAMVEANWFVTDKKGFGQKRSMSIAYADSQDNALNQKISQAKIEALRDHEINPNLNQSMKREDHE